MSEVDWSSVSIKNILVNGARLEASYYNTESIQLRDLIDASAWNKRPLVGINGFIKANYPGRFKRVFLEHSELPIFRPSEITDMKPYPDLYLSDKTPTNLDDLRVKDGQILMTRSGTVGIVSLVSKTYGNQIFSDDLLRLDCIDPNDTGYVYAFLKSEAGQNLISTNNYGAVIKHIEPTHLEQVIIPDLPKETKLIINNLIKDSFTKRDSANDALSQAEEIMISALDLPPLVSIKGSNAVDSHQINVRNIADRFEATYHSSRVNQLLDTLSTKDCILTDVNDPILTKEIILPGRFKRIYVGKKNGVVFFGGKQIYELDPSNKKYLSTSLHDQRIRDQLTLTENMVLVTCSGTIGRVQLTPRHWSGWTVNQHVLRIVPKDESAASLMYIWLQSAYGKLLIKRFSYGAVVDEIDDTHLGQVKIPIPKDKAVIENIRSLVMKANLMRAEAYKLEQDALQIVNHELFQ